MMTYQETIDYLYAQLPMFTRIGAAAYKEDLHNTIALCEALGNPQQKIKTIHVAGTNGKGSVCHMLAAILQQCGYKTGLYTSPHIKHFGERIRINGEMISEQFVIDFTEQTIDAVASIQPSFFELTVAMAFTYFAKEQVDIAIIETGLGGLLDSTNVITPLLSIITNIGLDHTQLLGNTLQEIARQKAGIIKQDTPVVLGEVIPETKKIFENEANQKEAPLVLAQSCFATEFLEPTGGLLFCHVKNLRDQTVEKLRLDLNGLYQSKNICTVLAAVEQLRKLHFEIDEIAMRRALENVKQLTGMRGRWELVQEKPTVVLDVAHNPDGFRQIMLQLQTEYPSANYHFILGFAKDKDVTHALEIFPADATFYFTNAHIPRALPYTALQEAALTVNISGAGFDDVNDALAAAKKAAAVNDVIVVCGSFFIISELQ